MFIFTKFDIYICRLIFVACGEAVEIAEFRFVQARSRIAETRRIILFEPSYDFIVMYLL